jgi:ferredoxin--NADP+ reductase
MEIIQKQKLSASHFLLQIEAPEIAKAAKPGQFVIVCPDESTQFPMLLSGADKKTISLVFSTDHKDAQAVAHVRKGMSLHNVIGPLGKPIPAQEYGNVVLVADNEGIGPALYIAEAMRKFENRVLFVAGFDSDDEVYGKDRIEAVSNKFAIAVKRKEDTLDSLLSEFHNVIRRKHTGLVIACCKVQQMAAIAKLTELRTKNMSLLTPLPCDGVGMFSSCRLLVGEELKTVCQDGPALDGERLDWPSVIVKYKAAGRSR